MTGSSRNPSEFSAQPLNDWRDIVRTMAESGWRLQVHTIRDHTAQLLLPALEEVNAQVPFADRRWYFVHLEDASVDTIQRIKAQGMGISIQDRTAFCGEDPLRIGGEAVARRAPPIVTELDLGVPVGSPVSFRMAPLTTPRITAPRGAVNRAAAPHRALHARA